MIVLILREFSVVPAANLRKACSANLKLATGETVPMPAPKPGRGEECSIHDAMNSD